MAGKAPASLQGSNASSPYGALDELHQLANAKRFNAWIIDALRVPVDAEVVLEIGAGIGTITKLLDKRCPTAEITSLEPSDGPFAELTDRQAAGAFTERVTIVNETSTHQIPQSSAAFDVAVHINVLEHIEDDLAELKTVRELLKPGGTLHLFVPALPALYGPLDAKSGHYRRYQKKGLRTLVEQSGLKIERIEYFDLLGSAPYFLMSKLGKGTISAGDVEKFDRIWVAISKRVDRLFSGRAPFGKNLVVIASRT